MQVILLSAQASDLLRKSGMNLVVEISENQDWLLKCLFLYETLVGPEFKFQQSD
jgi:hypothetical protein